jgi:hypothetical protein
MLIKRDGGMFRIGRLTCDDCGYRFLGVAPLLPFLQTLFDIALLRKGPQHIPRSIALLLLSIALWLFAVLTQITLIAQIDEAHFGLEVFSALVGITCYSMIIVGFAQAPRLTQTITALLGCGALLALVFVAAYKLLEFVGSPILVLLVVWTIVLWSIAIKGHIIATTINRHWYIGLAIAVGIFVLQHIVHHLITAP